MLAAICYFFAQLIGSLTGAACVLVSEGDGQPVSKTLDCTPRTVVLFQGGSFLPNSPLHKQLENKEIAVARTD